MRVVESRAGSPGPSTNPTNPAPLPATDLPVLALRHDEADVVEPDGEGMVTVAVVEVTDGVRLPVRVHGAMAEPAVKPPVTTRALLGTLVSALVLAVAPVVSAVCPAVPIVGMTIMTAVGMTLVAPPRYPVQAVRMSRRCLRVPSSVAIAAPTMFIGARHARERKRERRHCQCAFHGFHCICSFASTSRNPARRKN